MFCKECGAPLGEGANFCEECGAPVSHGNEMGQQYPAGQQDLPRAEQQWDTMPMQQWDMVQPQQYQDPQYQGQQYQGAQGFLQAHPAAYARRRGSNLVAVVCVAIAFLAMAGVVYAMSVRFGVANFLFEDVQEAEDFEKEQPQTTIVVSEEEPTPFNPNPDATRDDEKEDVVEATYGATAPAGNLANGGYVAKDDDWVYYAIPQSGGGWHTTSIGRMREDGSEKSVIYHASRSGVFIWHMVVERGRLYFVEEREDDTGGELISIETNGSGRSSMGQVAPSSSLMLNEGVIYVYVEDGLMAYEPKTGNSWYLFGGPSANDLWRTCGSGDEARVYYFRKGGTTVSSAKLSESSLSGTQVLKLKDKKQTIVNLVPYDDGIWILVDDDDDGRGDEVMHAKLDGSKLERYAKTSGPAIRINPCDEGVFLVVCDDQSTRIELVEKKDATPVTYYVASSDADVRLPVVLGDYLYFGVYDSPQHIYRMPLSSPGSQAQVVG